MELNTPDLSQMISGDHLSNQIRMAFQQDRLYKGFTQVVNAISLYKNLEIYVCGELDRPYRLGLDKVLTLVNNPSILVHHLPNSQKRLVYDAIANESRGKPRVAPRRFFNTRVFAIQR